MCVCQSGGIECLCDILCDGGRSTSDVDVIQQSDQDGSGACRVRSQSERVRSEAAGVIAQITSPSLVLSARVDEMRRASLRSNMPDLVPALTGMVCWQTLALLLLLVCLLSELFNPLHLSVLFVLKRDVKLQLTNLSVFYRTVFLYNKCFKSNQMA